MTTYVIDLLYKDNYLCDNIKNMNNLCHGWENVSDKTTDLRAIFSLIIVEAIIIIFY